jgi:NAD(P)-dependent dehydrogenase (short-subunit alcohol dehydrogenase family)
VFLAGRALEKLERVAEDIRAAGGQVEVAEVDALDERAVDEHADAVAAAAGGLDVVPRDVVHPGLLGGWWLSRPSAPRRTPDEAAR